MTVVSYDNSVLTYDTSRCTYDGVFLGGSIRLDDLFIPKKEPRLTDLCWPDNVDTRGSLTSYARGVTLLS